VNQISLISSLFVLYLPLTIHFSTMLIRLIPKYLRSLVPVQHARHITHGELMSREIKRLAVGAAWICGAAEKRKWALWALSLWFNQGLTVILSLSMKLHKSKVLFHGMSLPPL